ncbi:pyridoxal phosphate-dependent decarboxylase family protein [Nonomuraea muscovyensis]|uniref:L-2,4-diaminobutyrate decarboxylase n=1 Tax=Nonomuraea muscovyensis TaxID=1124761 RepID=A0A7X0F044_9ACTN|nr:pyridoxal-dependent decarboxylase [Nonomuraea muscovyensis]MBB6350508.1 L-2,4-diaminobutyrate decarboxylase [Nonomuraea muscovyensis]
MWNIEEFTEAAGITVTALAAYVDESQRGAAPVVRRRPPRELADRLGLRDLIEKGGMTPDSYEDFLRTFLAEGTRLHHPAYLAHQTASPDFPAALADFVHGATNNPMAVYEMGAAAATVEFEVLRWMLAKVGFPAGGGVLTHGGSLANLTALLAARARAVPDAWDNGVPGDLVILAPPAAHYSVSRAASILGLGQRSLVPLETDALGRIDVTRLPDVSGKRVMALVAGACATGTGLYDDLGAIGAWCRERGIWFHVDGAHGASALLSERHAHLLDGVDLADSVIWDAHKMLRTSSLAAAVLVRREGDLDAAFRQEASYLFYGDQGFDLINRTVECTKAELGLKIFMNLAWRGERGIGDYVAGRYDTAHRFWELARRRPGFDLPYEPESNIVCFRYGGADQAGLRERMMRDGSFHLSSTELNGVRHLRVTVMAPATDDRTLEALLDEIVAIAA